MTNLFRFKTKSPTIYEGVYIAPNASVIGDVRLMANSSVWFGSVLRGDVNSILVGENSNIQDLSMLHVTKDNPLIIGNNVTIAHNVNLHGATLEDYVLVGIGAIILDGAVIGENSVIAAGTLIPPGKVIPARSLVMGNPYKIVKTFSEEECENHHENFKNYLKYKDQFQESFSPISIDHT